LVFGFGGIPMVTTHEIENHEDIHERAISETQYERWVHWPVNWSAVWVGALASIAVLLLSGLIAIAVGAHLLGPENRVVSWSKFSVMALAFSVLGSFLAFVAGGWVCGKIAGILHAEPAMLHGAIAWLVAVPLLVVLASLGAANFLGAWHGGLAGSPSWAAAGGAPFEKPEALDANATEADRARYRSEVAGYQQKVQQWKEETPRATRNSALAAVTALLLSLVGSVIGGWMAAGEPMTFTYHRRRNVIHGRPVTART